MVGAHFNPASKQHGMQTPAGHHACPHRLRCHSVAPGEPGPRYPPTTIPATPRGVGEFEFGEQGITTEDVCKRAVRNLATGHMQ